jgi:hypothetical protein
MNEMSNRLKLCPLKVALKQERNINPMGRRRNLNVPKHVLNAVKDWLSDVIGNWKNPELRSMYVRNADFLSEKDSVKSCKFGIE